MLDVIVYSGSNAMNSHPRHMARYAVFCHEYFRQRGRFDRTVVTMDPKFSDTAKCSDKWIGFEQNGDYGFYNAILLESTPIKVILLLEIKVPLTLALLN